MAWDCNMLIDQLDFENQIIPYGESKEITFSNSLGAEWTLEIFFYRPFGLKLQLPFDLRSRRALLVLKCENLRRRVFVETKILITSKYCSLINKEAIFENYIDKGDNSIELENIFDNVYGNIIALNVSGELKIYVNTENYFYYKQKVCFLPAESKVEGIHLQMMHELSADLLSALSQQENISDVVLKCESEDYKAHKVVLSARSKVFSAMFQHPTKVNGAEMIEIKDVSSAILQDVLEYIYSGKVTILNKANAYELVAAAEQYSLPGLKKLSLYYIQSILSPLNALKTLTFAELYDEELKKKAIDCISMEFDHLKDSETWRNFQSEQPQLANEVLFNILHFVHSDRAQAVPTKSGVNN